MLEIISQIYLEWGLEFHHVELSKLTFLYLKESYYNTFIQNSFIKFTTQFKLHSQNLNPCSCWKN